MPPVLGYWDLRGICEPIRLLLHFKNVPFEDKRYIFGEDGWLNDKFSLGLDFPNLPYYIEGDIKITQSKAILRYLAHKHGMDGKTEKDKIKVNVAEQQCLDMMFFIGIQVHFKETFVKDDPEFLEKAHQFLKLWEAYFNDKDFVAGDYITYADFMLYEMLDFYRLYNINLLKEVPNLIHFMDRIRGLPELQNYWTGPVYKNWPIFGPIVKWGGSGPEPEHSFKKA